MSGPHIDNITQDQARALIASEWWVGRSDADILLVQMYVTRTVMPFALFMEVANRFLGDGDEFGDIGMVSAYDMFERRLRERLGGRAERPTYAEVRAVLRERERALISPF